MKKDWIERELTVEIVVGVFMVAVIVGLASFTFVLSGKKWGEEKHEMTVLFSDVMGLKVRDSVIVRGMPLGSVTDLELDQDLGLVRVGVTVSKKLTMREGYKVAVVSTSILGGRVLDVFEGPDKAKKLEDGAELYGQDPHDLMTDAAELVSAAKEGLVGEGGVIDALRDATVNIKVITDRLAGGEGTMGKLLSEDDQLYNDLSAAVASIREIAERMEKGEGMIGKLMSEDNTLYNELEKTVKEARAVMDDMRETSPVVTFTSVFFGAF